MIMMKNNMNMVMEWGRGLVTGCILAFMPVGTFAVEIETDKKWYLAGEAMMVCVTNDNDRKADNDRTTDNDRNTDNGRIAGNDRIAYAELCDTRAMAAGTVISLDDGIGIIELPRDMHSGYYVLSAYTRGDTRVAHRLIPVVNPLRKNVYDDIEWVQDDSCWVQGDSCWVTNDKKADIRETEGHIIKARVRNDADGNKFKGGEIRPTLSVIGKQIHYFEGKMVNDTLAVFNTFGVRGRQPIVLSAESIYGASLPIEMISPFAALLPKALPRLVFHYKRSEVEARSLDMQRHQIAIAPAKRELQIGDNSDETAEEVVPLDYDPTVFATVPNLSYNLDEYRQFLTVREALLEYVINVAKRKVDGVMRLYVIRENEHYNSLLPTLVLIDGMPVTDVGQLLSYDARRIHYINIYDGQYTFGNSTYNGILSFVTRSGRLTNYPVAAGAQYLVYQFQ